MVDRSRLIHLLQDLIRIDSQNPGATEARIAAYVARYLKGCGVRSRRISFAAGRDNIIASIGGSPRAPALLITPHLDTVPAGGSWKKDPFAARISAGKMYGLGASDCKVNCAVALEVIRSLMEDGVQLSYRLVFAATADEECGSALGLIPLLQKERITPRAALVLDSDEFAIIVAQKGLMHLKVRLHGKKAHGAYPWLGRNAIVDAMRILQKVTPVSGGYRRNRYLKAPTVNIGAIRGGDKVNVVADWCEFELDYRYLPGMSAAALLADLKKLLKTHALSFEVTASSVQDPYEIDPRHPLVKGLVAAMKACRVKPVICGSEGATVITFFQHQNIPAVATGFGSEGCAHIADEYVRVDNVHKGALVLERFLKGFSF